MMQLIGAQRSKFKIQSYEDIITPKKREILSRKQQRNTYQETMRKTGYQLTREYDPQPFMTTNVDQPSA